MRRTAPTDLTGLEAKVKDMYRAVAGEPNRGYHFELGRDLAEGLGYPVTVLDLIPKEAVESFAGVGYLYGVKSISVLAQKR